MDDNDGEEEDEGEKEEKRNAGEKGKVGNANYTFGSRSDGPRIPKFYRENAADREEGTASSARKKGKRKVAGAATANCRAHLYNDGALRS